MAMGGASVYIYGIVSASAQGAVSDAGVEGADVRTIRQGRVAALVSDLDTAQLAAAREIRAHWRVLEAVGEWATVLPVRFGTVLPDDEAVRERFLTSNEERLANLLEELAGRVQLSVKGTYVEGRVLEDIVRETPAIASLRESVGSLSDEAGYYQRINLGEMVFRELDHRREADSRLALDRLEPLAVAAQAEPPGGENGAFDLAFLVDQEKVPQFSAAVSGLGDEVADRIEIRYVGPLPPYSFADAELTAGSA